jgi:Asp-tRNA(Asn)/Glu-tRNA(Gln) amidotransferase A subunit family amidase
MAAMPRSLRGISSPDPLGGTIADYQAGLRRGEWTAAEVTALALERCRTRGAALHAIDALADTALAEAQASDQRRKAGQVRGPLDGVPVFAKSIYDVNGLPTTGSSSEWAALFPDPVRRDAIEVARLRAAGAIVLGKTAADDFAYNGRGTSSHTGQVVNPHDPTGTRTPGGSSAGSAVAVLTGMAFAGLGTDDGGSNRIPAQFSGVVGIKPTFGLVPRTGVIPTWPYLDTHGSLARTVADAALALAAIAGADPSDPLVGRVQRIRPHALRDDALAGVRIGLVEGNIPRARMSAEALAMWDRAVADVGAAGATVELFASPVVATNYRDAFAAAATARGDVAVNDNSPGPTANALYRYFAGRSDDPHAAVRRGYAAYRAFYDVLPEHLRRVRAAAGAADGEGPGGTIVRALAGYRRGRAGGGDARGRHRRDDLADHAVQRPATGREVARHPHHALLQQLARVTGGLGPRGPGRGRDAGNELVGGRVPGR